MPSLRLHVGLKPSNRATFSLTYDATFQEAEVVQAAKRDSGFQHYWRLEAAQEGQPAIKAQSASFAWERQETPPALHKISLEALKGQLVMVVGVVGSGKSSLIAALLGELHSRGGRVEVSHALAVQRLWLCSLPIAFEVEATHKLFVQSLHANRSHESWQQQVTSVHNVPEVLSLQACCKLHMTLCNIITSHSVYTGLFVQGSQQS